MNCKVRGKPAQFIGFTIGQGGTPVAVCRMEDDGLFCTQEHPKHVTMESGNPISLLFALSTEAGINMNATPVHKIKDTIFIPLPLPIQRLCGGCSCAYCTTDRKERNPEARWDTLAVHPDRSHTWEVHMPEIHGKPKLRQDG